MTTPTLNRRNFIESTMLGALGVSIFPHLAHAETSSKQAEFFVHVVLEGGCSHTDSWDMKPHTGAAGGFSPINTKVDGFQICEHLSGLAKHADKMALIRGMSGKTGDHAGAAYLGRTSYSKIGTITHPSIASFYCSTIDDHKLRAIPQNILINGNANHPGSGYLPKKYSPVPIHDPLRGLDIAQMKSNTEFNKRIAILAELNHDSSKIANPTIKSYGEFYDQTVRLLNSKELEVFDISKESKEKRDKYGSSKFGQGCLLIRRMFEKGDTKAVEIVLGGWDNHTNIYTTMNGRLNELDTGLSVLINELTSLGIMQNTLIAISTDFGRTPIYNDLPTNANAGRDHFPKVFSQVLIGAGIKGGSIYGKTNATGSDILDEQSTVQDFNATIATALRMNISERVFSPEGRPFTVADKGVPIKKVLA